MINLKLQRSANAVALESPGRGTRVLFMPGQRSAGRRLVGPVFFKTEHHNNGGVGFVNLTVGNPSKHYRWAFQVWFYYKLPKG